MSIHFVFAFAGRQRIIGAQQGPSMYRFVYITEGCLIFEISFVMIMHDITQRKQDVFEAVTQEGKSLCLRAKSA